MGSENGKAETLSQMRVVACEERRSLNMTEPQKRNSSLFPGVTIFPELQRQKIPERNKLREKKLQRVVGLNDTEFRRLNDMSEQQFKVFMGSVLKKENPAVSSTDEPEEKKPISRKPRTLREKMQLKGWVVL